MTRVSDYGREALLAIVRCGRLELTGRAGWRTPDGSTTYGAQPIGRLVQLGLVARQGGHVVATEAGKRFSLGTGRDPEQRPVVHRLTEEQARALGLLVRHQRLIWSAECSAWETPVPYEWSSYGTVTVRTMSALAQMVLVAVQTRVLAEVTPEGEATAFRLGLAGGVEVSR